MATTYILESGDPYIRKRTEKGWTLDFVFNKDGYDWTSGGTFYYWGISGETEQENYADNNLSFSFTDDGRVMWETVHYKKYSCDSDPIYYVSSGQTAVLCSGGTLNDFNLTIVFERNRDLTGCDVCNFGGVNDLITGKTVTVDQMDWLTGATEVYTIVEALSEKWYENRDYRLGTLKIYLNGQKVYTLKDWEEIIPSQRDSENDLVQKFGEGTVESGGIHEGETMFDMIEFNYYEYPFTHLQIKDNYNKNIKPNYNITECDSDCVDDLHNSEQTATPTPFPTATVTPTPTPSPTPTFLPTSAPTSTPTPTLSPSATPTPFPTMEPTNTPTPAPTDVSTTTTPRATSTPTPEPTSTPTPEPTSTPTGATTTPTPEPTTTPTPEPTTSTPTPLPTDTPTPTPTETPLPMSGNSLLMENGDNLLQENGDNLLLDNLGYTFELVALPYNFPISGASIMNGTGGATSGTTEINSLSDLSRGFYFNSIDFNGVDRTDYYSGFTGQSVTITFTQNGSTAIYSGDTNSFKYWIANAPSTETGFVFGTGIGVPPAVSPSGIATLIQAAPTPWVIGDNVTVSLEIT